MARFIVWVRRHWVCTELTETTWRIWDSASSVIVRKDLEKWAKQLNWPRPQFEPSPQQVRGSNECGLYAAFFLLARCWGRQIPVPGTTSRTTVRHCAAHARDPGRFVEEMEKALTAAEGHNDCHDRQRKVPAQPLLPHSARGRTGGRKHIIENDGDSAQARQCHSTTEQLLHARRTMSDGRPGGQLSARQRHWRKRQNH